MALSAVGGMLGPVGGVLGGLVGSYIDQLIFSQFMDPIKGPRIDELRVPTFDEGAPAPWVQGPENRVPGQIIWVSKLKEVKSTSGGKGGGGGGAKQVTYDYFIDVAIAFARQQTVASKPVRKIWANSTLIYEADVGFQKTSTHVGVATITEKNNPSAACKNKAQKEYIVYTHDGSGGEPNFFEGLRSGQNVVVTGFASALNNGTFAVQAVTLNVGGVTGVSSVKVLKCQHSWNAFTCVDSSGCAAGAAVGAGASVTFAQTGIDEFNKAALNAITHYNGTTTQNPDSIIEAAEGSGKVPGFRGTTYVVLKDLKVTQWGGTVPGFEGLVVESATRSVGAAIGNLLTRNEKITANDYDVTGVTGNLLGMMLLGPKEPTEALKALMLIYDVEVQQKSVIEAGVFKVKLFFFNKESAVEYTVSDAHRGAHEAGSDEASLIKFSQLDPQNLPSQVTLTFVDNSREWQPGSANYRKPNAGIDNQARVSLPVTLTPSNALGVAKKMLWALHANERLKVSVDLPPVYLELCEADVLVVNDVSGKSLKARVTKIDRGNNDLIRVEAMRELVAVYTEPTTGETLPG